MSHHKEYIASHITLLPGEKLDQQVKSQDSTLVSEEMKRSGTCNYHLPHNAKQSA